MTNEQIDRGIAEANAWGEKLIVRILEAMKEPEKRVYGTGIPEMVKGEFDRLNAKENEEIDGIEPEESGAHKAIKGNNELLKMIKPDPIREVYKNAKYLLEDLSSLNHHNIKEEL